MTKRTSVLVVILILSIISFASLLYIISSKAENNEGVYKIETFKSGEGWGYQIKSNDKVIILQSYMPCTKGNIPFPNEKYALNTGKLVLSKISNQEIPTITIEELKTIVDSSIESDE